MSFLCILAGIFPILAPFFILAQVLVDGPVPVFSVSRFVVGFGLGFSGALPVIGLDIDFGCMGYFYPWL